MNVGGGDRAREETFALRKTLRICEDVVYRNLQGEAVILNLKTNMYCGLDPVGTRIWELILEHRSLDKVLASLMVEYEVTEDQGAQDILHFVQVLQENKLIEMLEPA